MLSRVPAHPPSHSSLICRNESGMKSQDYMALSTRLDHSNSGGGALDSDLGGSNPDQAQIPMMPLDYRLAMVCWP